MEKQKHNRPEAAPRLHRLFGFKILDAEENSIGKIDNIWMDDSGQPAFFGVQTGWLSGKIHIVPAHQAEVSYRQECVRVPHSEDKIKDAPSFDASSDLTAEQEREIYRYYDIHWAETDERLEERSEAELAMENEPLAEERETERARTEDERTIQLNEEQLNVGKREVQSGGVRLRKVIRTESVNEPVELRREELEIERVPADEMQGRTTESDLEEEDIFIPLREEEAVVRKEQRPREEIRLHKKTVSEHEEISDTVRREELEVDQDEDQRQYGT